MPRNLSLYGRLCKFCADWNWMLLYSHNYFWALFLDTVKILGNSLIFCGLAFIICWAGLEQGYYPHYWGKISLSILTLCPEHKFFQSGWWKQALSLPPGEFWVLFTNLFGFFPCMCSSILIWTLEKDLYKSPGFSLPCSSLLFGTLPYKL